MPSAHLHLMVRAEIANPPGRNQVDHVTTFLTALVDHVRMKVLMPARALYCDEPGNEGVTGDILLTTSNSVVHIWNDTGLFEFDLYSCAPYTPKEVVDFIQDYFDVKKIVYKFIDRSTDLIELT